MMERSRDAVTLRGTAALGARAASVSFDDDVVVVRAPGYTDQPIRVSLDAVAAVVDLRDRRARRLPGPMLLGRAPTIAGIGTASPQSSLHRATVGLVFHHPIPLPATLPGVTWDQPPAAGDRPAPEKWDVLAVNAGKQTDQLLVTFARRGTRRMPTLASGLTVAANSRAAGSTGPAPEEAPTALAAKAEQMLTVATICLVLVTVLTLVVAIATRSPSWLLVLALAVPTYLYGTLRQTRRAQRVVRRGFEPPSARS